MKKITVLVSLVGLMLVVSLSNLLAGVAFAQTEIDTVASNVQDVQNAETVTAADLGVSDPGFLPTNPFYFLKEFGRNVQRAFTFNSVSKVELELKITNEKAAEVKKIQEIVPNDNNAIIKGLENYKNSQEALKNRLESLNISSTTPGINKLMNSIAVDSVLHQKVLDEIGYKAGDSVEVKNIIDLAKERMDESIIVAAKENPINFTSSLENAFIDSKGSEFKYIRSLEIIDRLESKVPEEARASLSRLRENFSNQLSENIKDTVQSSNSEVVQRALSEMPGDAIRKASIINELRGKADSGTISTLEGVSKDLEKEYLNEQDLAQKAEEQLKFVRELMKKLEERMSRVNNGIDIKSNIEVAKNHLQKAETAFVDKKYGEVIGQSRSAEAIIRKSLSLFEEKFVNLEDLSRQVKELYSKINSYAEMLNVRKITADSNPKAYEALSNAKMHTSEAEKFIDQNSIIEVKKHISEARMSLEPIFKLIEQNTTNKVIQMPIIKPAERAINVNDQAPAIKKDAPVSNCEFIKNYPSDLEAMLKKGEISEKDYSAKLEIIKKELEKCSGQSVSTGTKKPTEGGYCTQEVKLCSDGSYVGRTGSNCEFTKCPGESSDSSSTVNSFSGAYWQCYDGKEQREENANCVSSESWKEQAKKFCEGHCYADNSKCGVNSFGVTNQCREGTLVPVSGIITPAQTSITTSITTTSCDVVKKDIVYLEEMLKAGKINENDYKLKRESLEKELNNCGKIPTTSRSQPAVVCEKEEYNPVCGANGRTYANECVAKIGGVTVKYKGECGILPSTSTSISGVSSMAIKEECGKEGEKVNRDPLAGPVTKQCCYGLKEDRSNRLYSVCIRPLESTITNTTNTSVSTGIANPASIFCVSKGYKNVIKSNADGSQYGVCIFNDGSECEEWKFYKGECREGGSSVLIPSVNTTATNPAMACPLLAPISPNAALECAEKGGKLISELDSNGCYLAPRCILPSTSSSDIRN